MTKSSAETYALNGNGTPQDVNSKGTYSRVLNLHGRSLTRVQIVLKKSKAEPVAEKKAAVEATSSAVEPNSKHSMC